MRQGLADSRANSTVNKWFSSSEQWTCTVLQLFELFSFFDEKKASRLKLFIVLFFFRCTWHQWTYTRFKQVRYSALHDSLPCSPVATVFSFCIVKLQCDKGKDEISLWLHWDKILSNKFDGWHLPISLYIGKNKKMKTLYRLEGNMICHLHRVQVIGHGKEYDTRYRILQGGVIPDYLVRTLKKISSPPPTAGTSSSLQDNVR